MRSFIFTAFLIFSVLSVFGQDEVICIPDTTTVSDTVIISPLPYQEETREDGGIKEVAVLGKPYQTQFSLFVPGEFGTLTITQIEIAEEEAFQGLPSGLEYACNPPSCIFPANEYGCILISGTPDNIEQLGRNDLELGFTLRYNLLGANLSLNLTYPDKTGFFPESAAGEYFIILDETTSTRDDLSNAISLKNYPNPFSSITNIEANALINGEFQFEVFNMMGQSMHREVVQLKEGSNTLAFNGQGLPNGMYTYSLSNEQGRVLNLMVVSRD